MSSPLFRDNASRVKNREALAAEIEAVMSKQPRSHWLALLEANDIPCGPINDYQQVFEDPQVVARELVVETEHPTLGRLNTLGSAIKLSATPAVVTRRAPMLGEHTDEILAESGFGAGEMRELRSSGAIS